MFQEIFKKNIPRNIKHLRELSAMTKDQLAKEIGVKPPNINHYESGVTTPSTRVLVKIVKLFNVTLDELFFTLISQSSKNKIIVSKPQEAYYTKKNAKAIMREIKKAKEQIDKLEGLINFSKE